MLDSGQDAESERYFVVMPRVERNLDDDVRQLGRVGEVEAVAILLKPANVLYEAGAWKIADFGIARFVDLRTEVESTHIPEDAMPASGWDAVNLATINVTQRKNHEWAHGATLWYVRLPTHREHRWHEVSYQFHVFARRGPTNPFGQNPRRGFSCRPRNAQQCDRKRSYADR